MMFPKIQAWWECRSGYTVSASVYLERWSAPTNVLFQGGWATVCRLVIRHRDGRERRHEVGRIMSCGDWFKAGGLNS